MSNQVKQLEFKINIQDTPKEYIDGLILGLVHSGHNAYLSHNNEDVCFTGWSDDIITQKVEVLDESYS